MHRKVFAFNMPLACIAIIPKLHFSQEFFRYAEILLKAQDEASRLYILLTVHSSPWKSLWCHKSPVYFFFLKHL